MPQDGPPHLLGGQVARLGDRPECHALDSPQAPSKMSRSVPADFRLASRALHRQLSYSRRVRRRLSHQIRGRPRD